jgi:Trehalose receptor
MSYFKWTPCNFTGKVPYLQVHLYRERPHLFRVIPYHWWIFPIFQFTITCLAFCWNFVDNFIIMLAIGLSTRFNQLNLRLQTTSTHQMDNEFWLDIRQHYTNLIDLLDYVNNLIPFLLLLSMSHNVFNVMTKTFEAIKWVEKEKVSDTKVTFFINNFFLHLSDIRREFTSWTIFISIFTFSSCYSARWRCCTNVAL